MGQASRKWGNVQDRHLLWACAGLALIFALVAPSMDPQGWTQRRWSFLGHRALDTLLLDADLPTRAEPVQARLALAVHGRGLSKAESRGIRDAVVRHPGTREVVDSSNHLLVDLHQWGRISAVQLRLYRRGWGLRMQSLERMIQAPFVPSLALLIGALCCLGSIPRWLTMPVAAGAAQAMLAWFRRGEPYRVIPVHWTEWPDGMYRRLHEAWIALVLHQPIITSAVACLGLLAAWRIGAQARAQGEGRRPRELLVFAGWLLASVLWWDAYFRSTLPVSQLQSGGAGMMRLGHVLLLVAWLVSGVMVLRRPRLS